MACRTLSFFSRKHFSEWTLQGATTPRIQFDGTSASSHLKSHRDDAHQRSFIAILQTLHAILFFRN
eukprot:517591-Rhodomonas_salina.1